MMRGEVRLMAKGEVARRRAMVVVEKGKRGEGYGERSVKKRAKRRKKPRSRLFPKGMDSVSKRDAVREHSACD